MRKTIEKIWDGEINPVEFTKNRNIQIIQEEKSMYEKIEQFENMLDSDLKHKFGRVIRSVEDYISECSKQSFCDGFAIGSRLTAESFISAENIGT